MSNILSEVHPELVAEWSDKNLPLTPDRITYGSNKVVWWKGACGHEWQTSVKARSNGENCPICSGARVIEGINDLATLKPELADEWSSKNDPLKPTMVTTGSHKKVIWQDKYGHEWTATVKSRALNGTGCPYCSHNKVLVGFNDLASQRPQIASEWSERNYPLKPDMVTVFANRKVWWRCSKGHEWNTLISTRSGGSGCPYCSGQLLLKGFNDFAIYNVLYISISKDTRFYGLMKTLGTTQVQIKSLVKNQALKFACIGIPIGIVLATAVSFGIVPFVLNEGFEQGKSIMDAEMFFHPSIYILSVIFSAITVWIACNAPAKAAAKISPVEALKFQNFAPKKTKSRNSTNGGKLHIMAFHNVFRDKKRAILVFMSLFMGITMILGVNGVIGSMNAENFIKEYMNYHFEYNDIQFEQPEQPNKEVPQFDEHFVEQIQQVNGIENVDVQKTVWAGIDFDENALEGFMKIQYEDSRYKSKGQSYEQMIEALKGYADDGEYGCYITTLDDDKALEEYNAKHPDTPIDIEAFKRGETAIAGKDTEYNAPNTALVGETLTLTADSTDGKATDFKIDGAFYYDDYSNNLSDSIGRRTYIQIVPNIIFVSEAGMERLTKEPIISAIGVDIKDFNDLERIDSELQAINSTLTESEWQMKSAINQKEQFNQMFYSVNLLGNGAAILLIVIGLINFVNVMLTGVVARKNEFAIMESIGTTKKQIMKILTLEGGIYALISTLLIMTFGNAFLLLVADAVPHIANYAVFEYPVALVIGLIAAIFVICLSVPAIVYKATSDETVIERLHNFDN